MQFDNRAIGRRLAVWLIVLSIACWWGAGLAFSNLWWLTNPHQLAWIVFCYAWQVPVIGWTGVVLIPLLRWRAIGRGLAAEDPRSVHALTCFACYVAICALMTSSFGYALGAVQLIAFAHLPYLEAAKICVQGVLLGTVLGAAVFLVSDRMTRDIALSDKMRMLALAEPIQLSLSTKVRSITMTIALGAALPGLLFGFTRAQLRLEEARGMALLHTLMAEPQVGALPTFGAHTFAYVIATPPEPELVGTPVPIGRPHRATIVRLGPVSLDASLSASAPYGWFASRYDSHRVVAYRRTASGILVAISPLSDYGQALITTAETAGSLCLVALAIAFLLAWAFSRYLVDPLQRLERAALAMAEGQRDLATVAAIGNDEIATLTRQFDLMATRVREDEAKLVQSEKLSAVGRVVSGIAHELNNPLAAILHFAENLLSEDTQSAGDREMLQSVATQARRARSIVRDLLSFVRARAQTQQAADIHDAVRHATEAVAPVASETGAMILTSFRSDAIPLVCIDEVGIEQVLTNLIVNAAQAAGAGGVVELAVIVDGDRVRLSVSDTGPGIPSDVLPRIFEPFFTTKGPGKGTGLGLSVSLGIIQQHGGQLTVENRVGGGARFSLDVPVHPDQQAAAAALRERDERAAHTNGGAARPRALGETVMVIDDEESIRLALRMFLQRNGWRVEEADNGRAALDILLQAPANRYRAVITDLTMPDVTGIELHDMLATARPDICERLIISTGETISDTVVSFRARSGKPFLEKPFEFDALTALLEQMP